MQYIYLWRKASAFKISINKMTEDDVYDKVLSMLVSSMWCVCVSKSHEAFIHMDYLVRNWKFNDILITLLPEGLTSTEHSIQHFMYFYFHFHSLSIPLYLTDDIDRLHRMIDNSVEKCRKLILKSHGMGRIFTHDILNEMYIISLSW